MKKLLIMFVAVIGMAAFTTNSSAQVSISCPEGDTYKCAEGTNADGSTWLAYKGTGNSTITKQFK